MRAPPSLHPADLDRLARIAGMFGSDHDGERASAALKADQLLRSRGVSWAELVGALKVELIQIPAAAMLQHREAARECLALHIWNATERDFLVNISRKRRLPTPAQAQWLDDLLARARMARAA